MNTEQHVEENLADSTVQVAEGSTAEDLGLYHEQLAHMRGECPITHGTLHGGFYALTRWADVRAVFLDATTFSTASGSTLIGNPATFPPLECDPPLHTEYRKGLQPYFTAARVAGYEAGVRRVVDSCIDSFISRGSADLVAEFAVPVPSLVIAEILGLSDNDVFRQHDLAMANFAASAAGDRAAQQSALIDMMEFAGSVIDSRRAEPRDDIISALTRLEIGGRQMAREDLVGVLLTLIAAGHLTTTAAIGNLLLRLATHRSERERLIADPALVSSACNEILRYGPPLTKPARTVRDDVTVGGQLIPAGSRVVMLLDSANRDEERFPAGDTFVLDRDPNPHLAFGVGVHRCLGMPLGLLELRCAIEHALSRLPDYEIDPEFEPRWNVTLTSSDLVELPVTFTPGPLATAPR